MYRKLSLIREYLEERAIAYCDLSRVSRGHSDSSASGLPRPQEKGGENGKKERENEELIVKN